MESILDFNKYYELYRKLIDEIISQPNLWFKSLSDLQMMLFGYDLAFQDMNVVDKKSSFSYCFVKWLDSKTGKYDARGWSFLIASLGPEDESEERFFALVKEFLTEWVSED